MNDALIHRLAYKQIMIKYRNKNVKVPLNMAKYLEPYMEDEERIIDLMMETIIPAFDFRWLILTDYRIIRVIYSWFEYDFHDVSFDSMDVQLVEGIFYDSVTFKSMTDNYKASFYVFSRERTKTFMQEIEDERQRYQFDKKKEETKTEHHVKETLIVEGELSPEEDPGHKKRLERERDLKARSKKPESVKLKSGSDAYSAIKTIGELDDLKEQGLLSDSEYREKRREILDRMQ